MTEDLVQMAKDAERYRWLRDNCESYFWDGGTPAEFEEMVDAMKDAE